MRKLCLVLLLAIISLGCEGEIIHYPDDGCPNWQIQVDVSQMIRLVNEEGSWNEQIDFENLRLFATDTDWNIMVNNNGEPLQEIPNGIEAKKIYDQNGVINYIYFLVK